MNINTNYNISNCYSNMKLREQQNPQNNSAPAFKMAEKFVTTAIVTAPLVATYLGTMNRPVVEAQPEEPKGVTLDKLKDYMKGRTNFDNVNDVKDIVYNHPDIVNRLLEMKNPDGSQYFEEYDLLYNVLSPMADKFLDNPEKVFAVLNNPEELVGLKNENHFGFQAAMLRWAVNHPLDSTREANPGLFEPEAEITEKSVAHDILAQDANEDFKLAGLKILYSHPELVGKLAALKDSVGHQFLDSYSIAGIISNTAPYFEHNKAYMDKINKMINDPKELGFAEGYMSRGFGFWRVLID